MAVIGGQSWRVGTLSFRGTLIQKGLVMAEGQKAGKAFRVYVQLLTAQIKHWECRKG
jgi:hypothetical protein